MDNETLGWIAGVVGGLVGLLGGVIGTYFSVKNTQGPKEKAYMIKMALLVWVFVLAFLAALFALPQPYNHLLWIPYALVLVFGIRYSNRKQYEIRQSEHSAGEN